MARRLPRAAYLLIGAVLTHRWFHPLHSWVYRRTGGWGILHHALGVPMLLLTTTGRRSGRRRSVPLAAVRDAGRWILVGSFAGRDRTPGWVHNLRAHAGATVEYRRDRDEVMAREVGGDERSRLWDVVTAAYPGFEVYQSRTRRHIPLFALEPDQADGP